MFLNKHAEENVWTDESGSCRIMEVLHQGASQILLTNGEVRKKGAVGDKA
jgi:hypothetical protein